MKIQFIRKLRFRKYNAKQRANHSGLTLIKRNLFHLLIVFLVISGCSKADGKGNTLISPDGTVKVVFSLKNNANGNDFPAFSVYFKGEQVVNESELGMQFENKDAMKYNLSLVNVSLSEKNESYDLSFGKTKSAKNHYNELDITLQEKNGNKRIMHVIFRAFDDGIAFRYLFPEQGNLKDIVITEELTTLSFVGNPKVSFTSFREYTNPHEGLYTTSLLSEVPSGFTSSTSEKASNSLLIDMPVTLEFSDKLFVAVTEANVRNYPGMYLVKGSNNTFFSALSPLPGQEERKAKAVSPLYSPWRVIMIGDRIGKLIESNIVANLCEPNAIGDISWINVGKTTWPWWNGNVAKNVDFRVGVNTATTKYYIDYAAANGITFHAISDDDGLAWYGKSRGDSVAFQDVTKPIPQLDMPEIMSYAKQKGVEIRLWVHYAALQKKLEEAFTLYEKLGIDGLMVDFLDRDDQEMMIFMEEVLQKAAKYHLKIQFHGAPKPTGLKKTYPNLTNTEGVLNLEYLKWGDKCDPDHNVMVAFTRMLAGPLDYHLGGFRSVRRDDFAKGSPSISNYKRDRKSVV